MFICCYVFFNTCFIKVSYNRRGGVAPMACDVEPGSPIQFPG